MSPTPVSLSASVRSAIADELSGYALLPGAIEAVHARVMDVIRTPNADLPPLDLVTPYAPLLIEIAVPVNWTDRLDMQWVVEREIAADRWGWSWPRNAYAQEVVVNGKRATVMLCPGMTYNHLLHAAVWKALYANASGWIVTRADGARCQLTDKVPDVAGPTVFVNPAAGIGA